MTHLADVTSEKRFARPSSPWAAPMRGRPGPRVYHADDHVIAQSYLWAARNGAGPDAFVR